LKPIWSRLPLVENADQRARLRAAVIEFARNVGGSPKVRTAAIQTLAFIPGDEGATFPLVAGFVRDEAYQTAAIQTFSALPKNTVTQRPRSRCLICW
jgi:hypothetical protein